MDHDAIIKAYPSITMLDDTFKTYGLDSSGNKVIFDQTKVDIARTEINKELAATKYQRDRAEEYPDWGTQLDYIYHNGIEKWKTDIVDPVKAKYPKPS
tara:strand:- start:89 stop:382 length:294 start_codon:yes stop_codon:yes gene_type:complete